MKIIYSLFNRLATFVALFMIVVWPLNSSATLIANVGIDPLNQVVNVGDSFSVDVYIENVSDLFAYQFDITFDSSIIEAQNITEGAFLSNVGSTFFLPGSIDNVGGTVNFNANTLIGFIPGVSGDGLLAHLDFLAIGAGNGSISLSNVVLLDSGLLDISFSSESSVSFVLVTSPVPEPSMLWLLAAGLGFLGVTRFHK